MASYDFDRDTLHSVISQYLESPNLIRYIESFVNAALVTLDNIEDIINVLDIDRAEGQWLDLIGRIVGQDRIWYDASQTEWFAFENATPNPIDAGFDFGKFWDGEQPLDGQLVQADDAIHRQSIKARILKNTTHGTADDLLRSIEYITGRTDIKIDGVNGIADKYFAFDGGNPVNTAGFDFGFFWNGVSAVPPAEPMKYRLVAPNNAPMTPLEKSLILDNGLLPEPAGVKLIEIVP